MGLTANKSLRLEGAGLDELFDEEIALWRTLAENTYLYVSAGLADSGEPVRRDDLIAPLVPVLEVTTELREYLEAKRLKQKYWNQWFAELIVDRLWEDLGEAEDEE
jgi:hypothetical protein